MHRAREWLPATRCVTTMRRRSAHARNQQSRPAGSTADMDKEEDGGTGNEDKSEEKRKDAREREFAKYNP
eukprot:1283297-Rhodomonas_salina.1